MEHSARMNSSVMYKDSRDGGPNFQWYGWDSYFSSVFKPLAGIRKYHHFRFTNEDPGYVYAKEHVSDTEEKRLCVLKRGVSWPPPLPEFLILSLQQGLVRRG